jgi:hypothetical protein
MGEAAKVAATAVGIGTEAWKTTRLSRKLISENGMATARCGEIGTTSVHRVFSNSAISRSRMARCFLSSRAMP